MRPLAVSTTSQASSQSMVDLSELLGTDHSGSTVGRVFFPKTSVTIVILFWLKWAGYLAVAGLNLLAQLSDSEALMVCKT